MEKRPNLFEYATSELSQDAFLTWLISWADKEYSSIDSELNLCAVSFIQKLLQKEDSFKIDSIETGRQQKNIDIWALVNNKYFIVIEDKKGTREHSDQLQIYAEYAKKKYKESEIEIILVYFKMEEQGDYSQIKQANYYHLNRATMLMILQKYHDETEQTKHNDIIVDFYKNLINLNEKLKSYKEIPVKKTEVWDQYAWQGFYTKLQEQINGNWEYVPNPSNGFMGFWWHFKDFDNGEKKFQCYLQLEENKLIFKLTTENENDRNELREFYRTHLFEKAKELDISISKFGRLGKYMGVAILDENYRVTTENDILDFERTVLKLKEIMHLLNETEKKMKSI